MLHSIQVYTVSGHLTLIAGSFKEAKMIADILFDHPDIHKIKVQKPPQKFENTKLDLSDGSTVYERY